ncbi:MAG: ATP-binding protein [Candidatus Binatia bacterium]
MCQIPRRGSCFLFGPRQTGKSTLVRSLLPARSWTVDLLHHDTFLRYSKDPAQFRLEADEKIRSGARTIFVDEIQKVPALLDEVHGLIESTATRFILTGSSARKIKRTGANLLAGRAAIRRLHPLTLQELGERFQLDRTLRFGSLPAVATRSDEEARELLAAYAQTYLREEIQAEAVVRNLGGFGRFLDVAAAQCGDILNYTAVGRDASLATRTVQEYFQILEDTLIGFRLDAWRKSPRARLVAHPRFYLFDTGVTNALNRRLTASLDPVTRGRLFEQWTVLECARVVDYLNAEINLYYWRTNQGAEVDLLMERHGRLVLALEIKAKTRIVNADISGLRSFAEAHPSIPRVVIALVPEEYRLGATRVLPYKRFFARIEDWL